MGIKMTTTADHLPPTEHSDMNWLSRWGHWLTRPTDSSSLGAFRILFGLLMVYETYRYFYFGRITRYYVEPDFYFTYELFPMIQPWPEPWIYIHFVVMGMAALGIALGLFYRVSTYLFLVTYSYVFLMDKAQHNNHYYFIILLALLLVVTDAHRWLSMDSWRLGFSQTPEGEMIPFWHILIVKAQVFVVYFYAAVAKMNADWLALEPIRTWLQNRADYPIAGTFFATEAGAMFFGYGGLLFDLLIGFFLLSRRTRFVAFLGVLFFHLMNKWLFSIGVFPYLGIASTILFVETDTPRRWMQRFLIEMKSINVPKFWQVRAAPHATLVLIFVGAYLGLQVLLPFRHWLYPGNVSWHEQGHRFSWHMKLRSKTARITFFVTNPKTDQTWQIDPSGSVSTRQYQKMSTRPDMILQFAHHIRDKFIESGEIEDPIVRVEAWASLNGRPFQQFIDPTVDLAKEPHTLFVRYTWVLPLEHDVHGNVLVQNVE